MEVLRILAKETVKWAFTGPKLTAVALILTVTGLVTGILGAVPQEQAQSIVIAAFIVGLLGFLIAIFKCGAASKGRERRLKVFGTAVIPILGAVAFATSVYVAETILQQSLDSSTYAASHQNLQSTPSVVQEPELLRTLQNLGAKYDYSELSLIWIDNPTTDCGWNMASGCYQRGKVLKMQRNLDSVTLKTVLAHEYLHYVWYSENLDKDARLTSELIALYAKYPEFQRRIDGDHGHYRQSGMLQPTEFFSYGCTEISNAKLGSYISSRCKQYIDTDRLPALF